MIEVKNSNLEQLGLGWKGGIRDGVKTANLKCPNGHIASLAKHQIANDGIVSPSVVCPYSECGFHEFIKLVGWGAE